MDLKQRKLTKSEWESIEIPVPKEELEVLTLIQNGFHNVNIRMNKTNSIFTHLKIEYDPQMEKYLFGKFSEMTSIKCGNLSPSPFFNLPSQNMNRKNPLNIYLIQMHIWFFPHLSLNWKAATPFECLV